MSNQSFRRESFPGRRGDAIGASVSIMGISTFAILIAAALLLASVPQLSRTTNATRFHSIQATPLQVRSMPGPAQTAATFATTAAPTLDHTRTNASYAALPPAFEPNEGQTDPQVKYLARARGYSLFLTSNAAYFALPETQPSSQESTNRSTLRSETLSLAESTRQSRGEALTARRKSNTVTSVGMQLLGSNPSPSISGENRLPGVTNYILGRDPSRWRSGVAHYEQVRYRDVYPGVDLAFHGASQNRASQSEDKFEFDFLISPGAKPEAVTLGFSGLKGVRTTASGDLVLTTSTAADLHLHRPIAFQETGGVRHPVEARFVLHANNRVSFALGNYDRNRPLVIDPTVTYSTYLGGSLEDDAFAIAVDNAGDAYLTGQTDSPDFPDVTKKLGVPGSFDAFVTVLSPTGALMFTTLVGGSLNDVGNAIAVDTTSSPAGIYVAGATNSATDFPTTAGTVQPSFLAGTHHAFVFKLALDGSSLLWSTFIEGTAFENALGLALARDATTPSDDDVYVVGNTHSLDLGLGTVNPLPGGAALNNGAGSNGFGDGFIAKVNNGGTKYLFLSYLGGTSDDTASSIAIDPSGKVYVTGQTISTDFPVTPGVLQPTCGTDAKCNATGGPFEDAFVTAITSGNTPTYVYSTYLGGENTDLVFAIAVDSAGNAYVTGQTSSTKFPIANPITGQSALAGKQDAFVTSLNPLGTALNYSTYFGGSGIEAGDGIAVDGSGNAYITGYTTSTDFPTSAATQVTFGGGNSTFGTDAFVAELNLNGSSLSLPFSTYLGGSGDEDFIFGALAVNSGQIYVTGVTNSSNFPTTKNAADGTYNSSGGTCTLLGGGGSVPCPDAFVTVYAFITATPLAPVSSGGSATSTITVSPFDASGSPVALSCSVSGTGTPAPTCSFSSNSISGGSGTSTLTVQTVAPTPAAAPARRSMALFHALWIPMGMVFAGGGLLCAGPRRKGLVSLTLIAVLVGGLLFLPACGGGSSNSGGGGGGCSAVPTAPSGLAASATTSSGTTLTWSADSAPAGCSITGYTVYQNGKSIGTPTATTMAVTGLSPATTYMFTVAASDAAGISAQSSAVSVTTGASGTPAGTYTITVTGTDGTLTHSIAPPLTLTVN